jgi:thioredoxin reductase (NADPH)
MPPEIVKCDLLVIGAGPAGCTAALYGARAGLATVMVSPAEIAGMMAEAPVVGNFPGQEQSLPGRQILMRIREQALSAGARHLIEPITAADFTDPAHLRAYGGQRDFEAAAVIVATGATARAESVPGEREFRGRGVCYCAACDAPLFKGEDLLVVGMDAQAAEEALALSGVARSVCLVSPAEDLRLDWALREAVQACANLEIRPGLRLIEITGDTCVTGATFASRQGEPMTLSASGVFLYLRGSAPATEFLMGSLATDENGLLVTDEVCQASVPGVFAAGDVRRKQVRQMVIAAADGCTAALAAERYIRGTPSVRKDHGDRAR